MSQAKATAARISPGIKGIVRERDSQLRLVTSVRLRWAAVLGQLVAVAVVMGIYGFPMGSRPLPCAHRHVGVAERLPVDLSYPARHRLSTFAATGLLAYDILQLAGLLYFTGGIQNPFSVLLVAPVTVAASTLAPRYAAALGVFVLVCSVVLVVEYYPLPWYEGLRVELPRDYKFGFCPEHSARQQVFWRLTHGGSTMKGGKCLRRLPQRIWCSPVSSACMRSMVWPLRRPMNSARHYRRLCWSPRNLSMNWVPTAAIERICNCCIRKQSVAARFYRS